MANGDCNCAVIVNGKHDKNSKFDTLANAQKWAEDSIAASPESEVYVEQLGGEVRRWDINRETREWSCREAPIT
jgi:hypothetical protein